MCLMLWIGTERPVPTAAPSIEPDPRSGHHRVEEVPEAAPIRARMESPHVTYVGSHQGCGCGYNSGSLAFDGFDRVADVLPLLEAMTEEEREEFLAEQRSRERLHALITSALADGPVEVYACWAGDEELPPSGVETVPTAWLVEQTAPLQERVRYILRDAARS